MAVLLRECSDLLPQSARPHSAQAQSSLDRTLLAVATAVHGRHGRSDVTVRSLVPSCPLTLVRERVAGYQWMQTRSEPFVAPGSTVPVPPARAPRHRRGVAVLVTATDAGGIELLRFPSMTGDGAAAAR